MPTRVLIVDDDTTTCELIQTILGSVEIEADTLTNSAQAAERLGKEKFDAVFLDVRMPSPDGIELARQIRASGLNKITPIVMITGEEDHAVLARAFQAGASFFLFKPVNRPRLLRLIKAADSLVERERRRYQRVKVMCKVSLQSGKDQLYGTTHDLSLNGMLVQAPRVFPISTLVQVGLELAPGTEPLYATGQVVRLTGDDHMGIQLQNISTGSSERLQEFLLPLILRELDKVPTGGSQL